MFNSILSDVLKELKLMKHEDQIIMIPQDVYKRQAYGEIDYDEDCPHTWMKK